MYDEGYHYHLNNTCTTQHQIIQYVRKARADISPNIHIYTHLGGTKHVRKTSAY